MDIEKRKTRQRKWYLENRERLLEKAKTRYQNDKEASHAYFKEWVKKNPEKRKATQKKYDQAHKEQHKTRQRKYRQNPIERQKTRARAAVQYAVKTGKLKKPNKCVECNSIQHIEAHHYLGYDKINYLNIQWLCIPCHSTKS